MPKLTLTHVELFALWRYAAHVERAPAYELERDADGGLYLIRHDHARHLLTPPTPPASPDERTDDAPHPHA